MHRNIRYYPKFESGYRSITFSSNFSNSKCMNPDGRTATSPSALRFTAFCMTFRSILLCTVCVRTNYCAAVGTPAYAMPRNIRRLVGTTESVHNNAFSTHVRGQFDNFNIHIFMHVKARSEEFNMHSWFGHGSIVSGCFILLVEI